MPSSCLAGKKNDLLNLNMGTCAVQIHNKLTHTKVSRSRLSINYFSHKAKTQLFKRLLLLLALNVYLFLSNRHGQNGIPDNDKMIDVWMFDSHSQVTVCRATYAHTCMHIYYIYILHPCMQIYYNMHAYLLYAEQRRHIQACMHHMLAPHK